MKKFFNTLLCGLSAMNTVCENDMANMVVISDEIFNG